MGLIEKAKYVLSNPEAVAEYFRFSRNLARNRKMGVYNFLLQCDAKGQFPYLKPYIDALRGYNNVAIFITGANLDGEVKTFLRKNGIHSDQIIENNSLVRLTDWDMYMSPTSWGNIFPKNSDCPRIQLFHTLADKNIQYGKNLINFNAIFVCGPIHHDFLKRYLFDPFPEAITQCKTYNVGYAKIDALVNGIYDPKDLRKKLNISENDKRRIILYAPNWETTSALYKYKDQVFEVLKNTDYIILVKIHYALTLSSDKVGSAGNIDWRILFSKYEQEENFRIITDASIDPYLSLSDLLITDYGGAAFEFMCTGKPIVYLDCPEFFEIRGKDIMEYWSRDSGYILSDMKQLPETIEMALRGDGAKERMQAELVEKLLYNKGVAAEAGIGVIFGELLSPRARRHS